MNWLLDMVPVELWVAIAAIALVVTWQIWWPVFMALPRWLKVAIVGAAALAAAYHKGRNTGAKGAVQRERSRNEEARQELIEEARVARERQRLRDADGVRDDADPYRRD